LLFVVKKLFFVFFLQKSVDFDINTRIIGTIFAILRRFFSQHMENIMKKLMVAAVAATMASVSMADISIKGDAFIQYADNGIGVTGSDTANSKRINLNVIGKSGATTVVASFRTDDNIAGTRSSSGLLGTSNLHQFYITSKVGPVNVKAGDFYGTIGLGAWTKSTEKTDAISLSTKVGSATLGVYTADRSGNAGSTNVSIAGKVAGAKVKLVNNPHAKWTDLSVSGTFKGISVAAESWKKKAQNGVAKKSISLIHVGGKAGAIKWDVAQYKNKGALASADDDNAKFAPLGSMLIGKEARGRTATAAVNAGEFSKILGVAVSTKFAGNTIKAIYTKNTFGAADKVTGAELILTRAVSGGKLTANLAKLSGHNTANMNATNKGIRFDVKF
jgi:hypothetical protein